MCNLRFFTFLAFLITTQNIFAQDIEKKSAIESREIWLEFTGTNYCKAGQCAELIPAKALKIALDLYKTNLDKIENHNYIGIIDFNIKSTQKRFFILNLKKGTVESMLVTHGKKSETELGVAGVFSNTVNSEMSSLGAYITDDGPYVGKHGVSLRLDGISESNSNARERNIVLHAADYATQWFADTKGRLGLSQGCPAVSPDKIEGVIKKLKGRGLLYIHKDIHNEILIKN
jgi:hypothetical protein